MRSGGKEQSERPPFTFARMSTPRKNKSLCTVHRLLLPSMGKPINLQVLAQEGCTEIRSVRVHKGQKIRLKQKPQKAENAALFLPEDNASWAFYISVVITIFCLFVFRTNIYIPPLKTAHLL